MARGHANQPARRSAVERQQRNAGSSPRTRGDARPRARAERGGAPRGWEPGEERRGTRRNLWSDEVPQEESRGRNGAAASANGHRRSSRGGGRSAAGKGGPLRRLFRNMRDRAWWTPRRSIIVAVVTCLLLCTASGTVDALARSARIASEASSGLRHLHNIQAMLPSSGNLGEALNQTTLAKMKPELQAAQHDFAALRSDLNAPVSSVGVAEHLPVVSDPVHSAALLAAAADEGCQAGLQFVQIGQTALDVLKGGFFASTTPPKPGTPPSVQLDQKTYASIEATFTQAYTHFTAAANYLSAVDVASLPTGLIKPQQLDLLRKAIAAMPKAQQTMAQVRGWLAVAPSILGIGKPTHFLLELMDRSELRATGGFIGNYGVVTISNGKVQPFDLSDVYLLDVPFSQTHHYYPLPNAYPWWPFHPWGLRDSNLSADFPTSAQYGMHLLQVEGGPDVQGVVAMTPGVIARMMTVTGNLKVDIPDAGVHEIVTPQNLESRIHFYQQTAAADPITNLPPKDQVSSPRKRFTALLARAFLAKLHGLTTSQMVSLAQQAVESLHERDLQVYLGDKNAESLLAANGDAAAITQGPGDGVTIVDDNVGANKGSQFTSVAFTDTVTIDVQGTATHQLAIAYKFKVTNPAELFGPDYYKTYLRVYAPPNAELTHQDGLENRIQLDQIGHSDVPGRQMWGGYVVVPDGQTFTLHFTWKVPKALVADQSAVSHYLLDFQHQAGTRFTLALTVSYAGVKTPGYTYNGVLSKDVRVNLPLSCLTAPPCPNVVAAGNALSTP